MLLAGWRPGQRGMRQSELLQGHRLVNCFQATSGRDLTPKHFIQEHVRDLRIMVEHLADQQQIQVASHLYNSSTQYQRAANE